MTTILAILIIVFLVLAVWACRLWAGSTGYKYQKIFAYIEYTCVIAAFITAMIGAVILNGGWS